MEYVALICAIVAGVAATIAAASMTANKYANKTIIDLKDQNTAQAAAHQLELQKVADDKARVEQVVAMLKAEIADLEKALASNPDPIAVRARLSKLLNP